MDAVSEVSSSRDVSVAGAIDQVNGSWQQLLHWQRAGTLLAFVYARSQGGLVQSGRGRIAVLSSAALTIDAAPCRLAVVLTGAKYESGPRMFFDPSLSSAFDVHGVAVSLGNHDWLFFSEEAIPAAAEAGASVPVLPGGAGG